VSSVDHPDHYGGKENAYETIKVLKAWGLERDALLWNVGKYLSRWNKKGVLREQVGKAVWYGLRRLAELDGLGEDTYNDAIAEAAPVEVETKHRDQTNHQIRVEHMMYGFGQEVPQVPTVPDAHTRTLRARLILEECLETIEALGVTVRAEGTKVEFDGLEFAATHDPDLTEIADGCVDISVVTIGTMSACGLKNRPLLELVDENNLLKIATASKDPVTGKFIKAPGHPTPDVAGEIERQRQAYA